MRALRRLGVPYTDEQIAKAPEELKGRNEQDAMVAYLQNLGLALRSVNDSPHLTKSSRSLRPLRAHDDERDLHDPVEHHDGDQLHRLPRHRRWAYSKRRKKAVRDAANAPFALPDDLPPQRYRITAMSDFTSDFWSLYVAVLTVASIVACGVLLYVMGRMRVAKGKAPGTTGHVWDEDLAEYNNPLPRWWM